MAWILLLIQVLPSVLKLIQLIRELIADQPTKAEKAVAWNRLKAICKGNLRKKRGQKAYAVRTSEETVVAELEALAEDLKAKAVA
jgi:hypothetical protein